MRSRAGVLPASGKQAISSATVHKLPVAIGRDRKEDRAPVGTDPSADPGVVSEDRAVVTLPPTSLAYNTNAENPSTTK